MRRVIRRGTFETNSSSMHTLSIFTEDAFNEWVKSGDKYAYINTNSVIDKVYTLDEVKDQILDEFGYDDAWFEQAYEEEGDTWLCGEFDYCTSDCWYEDVLEADDNTFKTSNGERFVVACKYGWA